MAIERLPRLPKQMLMVCGPGYYRTSREKKRKALEKFAAIARYTMPTDEATCAYHLWHEDLHLENIFVDPTQPTKILGVIDWQSVQIAPLFEHRIDPPVLKYDGPDVDGLKRPELPDNYDELSADSRAREINLYYSMALMSAYRTLVHMKTPELYRAIEFQDTTPGNLLMLARRIFGVGEAHVRLLILNLRQEWCDLPAVREAGNPPFPLQFSDAEVDEIEGDAEVATISIQTMDKLKACAGDLWPEKGSCPPQLYDEVKDMLFQLRDELVELAELDAEDREFFEREWPFQ
jgi:Phosphotransferase enzyme family